MWFAPWARSEFAGTSIPTKLSPKKREKLHFNFLSSFAVFDTEKLAAPQSIVQLAGCTWGDLVATARAFLTIGQSRPHAASGWHGGPTCQETAKWYSLTCFFLPSYIVFWDRRSILAFGCVK
jgi:hypothetical protein